MGLWDLVKKVATFDIREHTEEKVLTGTIPIGGVGAATSKLVGITKSFWKVTGKVAKTILPKTLKGKIMTGTAALMGVGILKESPIARTFVKERIKDIPKIPKKIIGFGGDVGGVIEKEKTFGKEDIVKGLKVAGIIGGVTAAAIVVAPKVTKKIKEWKEEKALESTKTPLPIEPEKQLITEKPVGIQGETPITPETTKISTGKTPYKRRRATKPQAVRQSVSINILNRSTSTGLRNTTYLKERILV